MHHKESCGMKTRRPICCCMCHISKTNFGLLQSFVCLNKMVACFLGSRALLLPLQIDLNTLQEARERPKGQERFETLLLLLLSWPPMSCDSNHCHAGSWCANCSAMCCPCGTFYPMLSMQGIQACGSTSFWGCRESLLPIEQGGTIAGPARFWEKHEPALSTDARTN